jgi:hypothetical protein
MNPAFWEVGTSSYHTKPGVDRQKAIEDLNVHPELYAIACQAATALTMEGGGKSPLAEDFGVAVDDWEEWFDQVKGWKGGASIHDSRRRPTTGIF